MSHAAKALRAELSASQQNTIQAIYLDLLCRRVKVREAFSISGREGYSSYSKLCIDMMNLNDSAKKGTHEIYLYDLKLIIGKLENLIDLIEDSHRNTLKNLTECCIKCHYSLCSIIEDIISPYQSI